jgi:hypothetical protein
MDFAACATRLGAGIWLMRRRKHRVPKMAAGSYLRHLQDLEHAMLARVAKFGVLPLAAAES